MAKSTKTSKAKAKKGRKNTSANSIGYDWRSLFRHALKLPFQPAAFKLYVVLLTLLCVYVVYLDATIRSSFEGKKWQLPARVYARPLELFAGLRLRPDELAQELNDLGYRAGRASQPGSYYRNDNQFTLYSRGHTFWDGNEQSQQAKISFNGAALSNLSRLDGQPLPLMRLEPLEIGAIYPNHREDRVLVKIEEVPPLLVAALLAVEDHRFYQHHGVSPASILRAALQNIKSGSVVQGGSTISQQLVKNYYLTHERSFKRKITEAIMALLLELHYDKEAILQAYLNEVYLGQAGARAIHGFGLASLHYFNRPLPELSVDRLALLIAIVRGPNYYDPWRHPERAKARRDRILNLLVNHELLTEQDAAWAIQQPLNLGKASRSHFVFPAYIDLVKRQLREAYKESDLTSNGLKVYTSFDPLLQRQVERAVTEGLAKLEDPELQAASIVVHPSTGEVLAMVGGREPRYAGFNRALDAKRSIGSVVKPFVYYAALSRPQDYTLATLIDDSAITIETEDGQQWSPRNYDRKDHGEVPLITAFARSYNQATARVGDQVGADTVAAALKSFGLQRAANPVPSLFVGATQLTPFEVSGLYQTLATGGYHTPLKAIRSVLDQDSQPLNRFAYSVDQQVRPDVAYLVQHGLIHVGRYGSARSAASKLGKDWLFAGKTGTSNKQRDSWFAGYTGDLLSVVWVGRDNNAPTDYTGSSGALPIWTDIIRHNSRQPLKPLTPNGIEFEWIDLRSGQRSNARCATAEQLPFLASSVPQSLVPTCFISNKDR